MNFFLVLNLNNILKKRVMRYVLILCVMITVLLSVGSISVYSAEWDTPSSTSTSWSETSEKNKINSTNFIIPVDSIFQTGVQVEGNTDAGKSVNFLLGTLIQKLMIGLGSVAAIIMSIGAGYMILHAGQDELLSKWKSIFISGLIAMIVALSSYYLVSLVQYILFN